MNDRNDRGTDGQGAPVDDLRFCQKCGRELPAGKLRYLVRIEVTAACEPIEVDLDESKHDYIQDIRRLIEDCEGLTEEELMQSVYVSFQFDLCRACQQAYIRDPLPPRSDG
ncbi:MAG: hypothetical protein AB1714_11450 [Acidobacteriota bacterium]